MITVAFIIGVLSGGVGAGLGIGGFIAHMVKQLELDVD
jgi:hypothetical protein